MMLVLEGSPFHGSDKDFVIAVQRSTSCRRRHGLYRLKIQGKSGSSKHRKNAVVKKSSKTMAPPKESALEAIAAAASQAQKAAEDEWFEELENDSFEDPDDDLKRFKGLVLDLSYRPINVVGWKRALCLEILEKAEVLVYYDQIVCSQTRAFFIPAVLRMVDFVYTPKQKQIRLTCSRTNVFIRDKFRCQYCSCDRDLTIDHVLPVSKGGGHSWENLVTACKYCNEKKGSRSLEDAKMQLKRLPKEPSFLEQKERPPSFKVYKSIVLSRNVPSEWVEYLPQRPPKRASP